MSCRICELRERYANPAAPPHCGRCDKHHPGICFDQFRCQECGEVMPKILQATQLKAEPLMAHGRKVRIPLPVCWNCASAYRRRLQDEARATPGTADELFERIKRSNEP